MARASFWLIPLAALALWSCARSAGPPEPSPVPEPAPVAAVAQADVPRLAPGAARLVPADPVAASVLTRRFSPAAQGLGSWTNLEPQLRECLQHVQWQPQDVSAAPAVSPGLTWGRLAATLRELIGILPRLDAEPGLLLERFAWYALEPETLLTGYYEPWIEASLTPDPDYPYPLYRRPDDLRVLDLGRFHPRWEGQTLVYRETGNGPVPYPDREAIDFDGALAGRGLEIAWAKNLVDVFILQIQGSGRLVLPDGSMRHILYAERNGREYVSLGRALAARGLMDPDAVSLRSIRAFLAEHPERMREFLRLNPSYVFFRLADEGPFGAMGVALTPLVSVAVDRQVLPLGAVLALDAVLPDGRGAVSPFAGLMLAQDTGGAITGTRMDLFCGSGPRAEAVAGHLQDPARVYLLLSRSAAH